MGAMSPQLRLIVSAAIAVACLCIGILTIALLDTWSPHTAPDWPADFSLVQIQSSMDGDLQPAYFFASKSTARRPLIVSLHTWSGNYAQHDPLAHMVRTENWNYIHPDFRGPNSSPDACLSDKVISDIDDAIRYAIANANVDRSNIFVTGLSGGGYAALGSYMKTQFRINAWLVWAPISDITAWYQQSRARHTGYDKDILKCTSTSPAASLDIDEAISRSPLYWEPPEGQGRMELYVGINDGHTGAVPISHSILFYNRIVEFHGYTESGISETDMVTLLRREHVSTVQPGYIDGRMLLYARSTPPISISIFDGGHEMLAAFNIKRIRDIIQQGTAVERK